MRKPLKLVVVGMAVLFAGIAVLLVFTGTYAAVEDPVPVPEEIRLEDKAYKKHKYAIAVLSHKKHQEDYAKKYPEFYQNGCGECHHDKDNKPLTELKAGDAVQRCIECHKIPKFVTGRKAKGLTKEQKRENQGNAMHDNCKVCHKKYNKKYTKRSKSKGYAPTSCKTCHPKKRKK